MDTEALLPRVLVAYSVVAKTEMTEVAAAVVTPQLPIFLKQANDMVSLEVLLDPVIVRQALHALSEDNTVEESLMFTFMLYIARLLKASSGHPLEVGIIRQKIIGMVPMFEAATARGLLRQDVFDSNAALLLAIADKTEDAEAALTTLLAGYEHYSKPLNH